VADAILVLNAGSSRLRFSVFLDGEQPQPLLSGQIEELLTHPRFEVRDASLNVVDRGEWEAGTDLGHQGAIEYLLARRGGALAGHRMVAASHRVVHGGVKFTGPVLVHTDTLTELEKLVPLAPLQQPHNLAAIRMMAQHAPQLPQVACFDTSFHRTQPWVAEVFGLPRHYMEQGVRRYGFHGLSYEYIASVLPTQDGGDKFERTVVAHFGNGASMCALRNYKSVATTMSLTPMDGLPMRTRCGSLDPGVLLYLMSSGGLDRERLERMLYHESGLLGMSGISAKSARYLPAPTPGPRRRSSCWCTALSASWARWLRRWEALTHWCSAAALGKTRFPSAPESAPVPVGWASIWTSRLTPRANHASAGPTPASPPGLCPRMKN
jgi:acetate kinase